MKPIPTKIMKKGIPHYRKIVSIADLASDYKFRGLDKTRAWDQFIIDRSLKPEINAGEFYKIFKSVNPKELKNIGRELVDFNPTHIDILLDQYVQIKMIKRDTYFYYELLWEDGRSGSNPPNHVPEINRFFPLRDNQESGERGTDHPQPPKERE